MFMVIQSYPQSCEPMGSEEDMPIFPIFEQIGEGFGRFDLVVHTSFPLLSFIFMLTPAPAEPNRCLLPHGYFSPIHASPLDSVIIY